MKKIITNKFYNVDVDFKKPTTTEKFKRSVLYKKIIKFVKDNGFILYYETLANEYHPSFGEYDPIDDPEFYTFSFLRKTHAVAVAKEFDLEMTKHDVSDGEYICWPKVDTIRVVDEN
jgi:hypothetical protein